MAGRSGPRFTSVAYGNGTFVAVAEGGIIATTVDGVEWTQPSWLAKDHARCGMSQSAKTF